MRRVVSVLGQLIASHRPDVVVIACNTASTAVLPPLRAQWPAIDFVGTVPAIKPAAGRVADEAHQRARDSRHV